VQRWTAAGLDGRGSLPLEKSETFIIHPAPEGRFDACQQTI